MQLDSKCEKGNPKFTLPSPPKIHHLNIATLVFFATHLSHPSSATTYHPDIGAGLQLSVDPEAPEV